MGTKTKKKGKRKPNRTSWGPDNPPPVSPGRPPSQDSSEMMALEYANSPGISERLAAVRVAVSWKIPKYPDHPMARFYVQLKAKNPRDFSATWERLEKEFEAGTAAVVVPVDPKAEEEPVRATETDEELREAIVELLRKHGEQL